jgi:hypothetical protein
MKWARYYEISMCDPNMTCHIYGQTSRDTHGLFLLFKAEMYNTDRL